MKWTLARYEKAIAGLLWYGTWVAVAVIAVGLLVGGPIGLTLVKAGIAIFILLPIGRVAFLLGMFVREKDRAYIAISALVLAILAASVVAGFYRIAIHP